MVSLGRITSNVGKLLFDPKYQTTIEKTLSTSSKNCKAANQSIFTGFGTQIKNAFLAAEKETGQTSVWQGIKKSVTSFPKDVKTGWNGTEGNVLKKLWGSIKPIGSRFPLIMMGMMSLFELNNAYKASQNEGLLSGAGEIVKSTVRISTATAAAAIAQALCPIPIVGGILGWMAGDKLASLIVGKSYSEKQAETQEHALAQAQNVNFTGSEATNKTGTYPSTNDYSNYQINPQNLAQLKNMWQMTAAGTMNDDFMYNASGLNKLA